MATTETTDTEETAETAKGRIEEIQGVVIEAVFSWPGIGQQAVTAISSEDLPLLMGTLLVGTFFIVVSNLVVDVLYAALDPRIRYE